jgi:hypothetical protein
MRGLGVEEEEDVGSLRILEEVEEEDLVMVEMGFRVEGTRAGTSLWRIN